MTVDSNLRSLVYEFATSWTIFAANERESNDLKTGYSAPFWKIYPRQLWLVELFLPFTSQPTSGDEVLRST